MRSLLSLTALVLAAGTLNAYEATNYNPTTYQEAPAGWHGTVGALVMTSPEYSGGDSMEADILPMLEVKYGDTFFASVQDGIGYNIVNNDTWRAGPVVGIDFGRDANDATALNGLGDIDTSAEIGAFVEHSSGNIKTKLEVRQATGGHNGLVADLGMTYSDRIGGTVVSFGPNLKYGDDDYTQAYYGVTAAQAARSGYAAQEADGGITSYGVSAVAVRPLEGNWSLIGLAGYDRLTGDAGDSALVEDENQYMLGIGLGYRF